MGFFIDWASDTSAVFCNPAFAAEWQARALVLLESLSNHLWFTTSGSTRADERDVVWVGIAKEAFLVSAAAVNQHLACTVQDRWLNPLPSFHVGGVAIEARASLLGNSVFSFSAVGRGKWDPRAFVCALSDTKATLTALVPTQVFDLVQNRCRPPLPLRAAIVGGSSLSPFLYLAARKLGWPLLPSYGMTEASSQVATASLDSLDKGEPKLIPLSHVSLRVDPEKSLHIRSASLFTQFARWDKEAWVFEDPKREGEWKTGDVAEVDRGEVRILGRADELFKVGGELVSLKKLDEVLEQLLLELSFCGDAALLCVPDERLGHAVHLATTAVSQEEVEQLVLRFSHKVMPYEKIRKVHFVSSIPRTALGKVRKRKLIAEGKAR